MIRDLELQAEVARSLSQLQQVPHIKFDRVNQRPKLLPSKDVLRLRGEFRRSVNGQIGYYVWEPPKDTHLYLLGEQNPQAGLYLPHSPEISDMAVTKFYVLRDKFDDLELLRVLLRKTFREGHLQIISGNADYYAMVRAVLVSGIQR